MIEDDFDEMRRPVEAWCDPQMLHVALKDGRQISTPLWWYPRLLGASPAQRADMKFMLTGIHWPQVDEDLSTRGMLLGCKARGAVDPSTVAEEAEAA